MFIYNGDGEREEEDAVLISSLHRTIFREALD